MPDDIYAQFGVSPKDYFIDPDTNTIKRKELPLPTEAPTFDAMGTPMPTNTSPDYSGINPSIGKLFGVGGNERYQTWPERMVRSGLALPADVYSGREPIVDDSGHTAQHVVERAMDTAGLAGMSTMPGVALAGGIAKDTLGIVPVARARELKVNRAEPTDILKSVAENTPGATLDPDGALRLNIKRGQSSEQEMAESVRGGVFYLPEGDKNFRHYKGTTGNNYGGQQLIEGETAYLNPLVVKGATGGKAPEAAYTQLKGKDAFKQLDTDVMQIVTASNWMKKKDPAAFDDLINRFLETHAPDLTNHAQYILENSKQGNQLRYALQEAAIANAVREAGHDGVIGYSVGRGDNKGKPRISEIFDVREDRYPSPSGDYSVHPQFLEDSKAATALAALEQSSGKKLTPVDYNPFAELEAGIADTVKNLPRERRTNPNITEEVPHEAIDKIHDIALSFVDRWNPKAREKRAEAQGFEQDAYHGTGGEWQHLDVSAPHGYGFYSTPHPDLANKYSDYHGGPPAVVPLKINTKDYNVIDAGSKHWSTVNVPAIKEAIKEGKKGIVIHNVFDNPDSSKTGTPKTVFISLDPTTVKSKFAKFNLEKLGLNDLLASGAALLLGGAATQGSKLVPIDYDPHKMTPVQGNPFQ